MRQSRFTKAQIIGMLCNPKRNHTNNGMLCPSPSKSGSKNRTRQLSRKPRAPQGAMQLLTSDACGSGRHPIAMSPMCHPDRR